MASATVPIPAITVRPTPSQAAATFERELKPWDFTKYIAPEPVK
jgi:hypothetical protein